MVLPKALNQHIMSTAGNKQTVRKSFYEVWRAFGATIQSLYKLAPCLVIGL
jgi:hypothetical protein